MRARRMSACHWTIRMATANSDLRAVFASPSGEETVLSWLWDAESGAFVCQPDSKG